MSEPASPEGEPRPVPADGRRTAGRLVAWAAVLVLLGGSAGWAMRTLLTQPAAVSESPGFTVVSARQGSVGQSIRLNVRAEWRGGTEVLTDASGTVTNVFVGDGSLVRSGDKVVSIGLHPVVIADGATPAFRDMAAGDSGPDVAQLQRLLSERGFSAGDIPGRFDARTALAVQRWQAGLGVAPTGKVALGSIVFAPGLPGRIVVADGLRPGSRVSSGQPLLRILSDEPVFRMSLPGGQTELVRKGQAVTLESEGGNWAATTGPIEISPDTGEFFTILQPVSGKKSICADKCELLPARSPTLVPSRVQVIPQVTGVVVPASAVVTTADDQTAVVMADGSLRGVRVVAGSFGTVVVVGVGAGEQVRAPGVLPVDSPAPSTTPS